MERSLRRYEPAHSSGQAGLALSSPAGVAESCAKVFREVHSNSSAGSLLGLAFSAAVTLGAGSRRDSRAESYRLWEDCRSVLGNLKDEI